MIWELVYTSAPRGLHAGTTGFCTVAATRGLPEVLAGRLEELSGYRELFPPSDPNFAKNPVAWSHVRLSALGRTYHVLSRVAAAPAEHTGRTNKLAHHVAVENGDLPEAGPAWVLGQAGFVRPAWNGEVAHLAARPGLPQGALRPAVCRAWERAAGDAGWAGWLVEQWLRDPDRPVYVLYPLGTDVLALFREAVALLPPEQRWDVTFSTYCRTPPQGVGCAWRGVPLEAPEAAALQRDHHQRVVVLTGDQPPAPPGPWVQAARTGQVADAVQHSREPGGEGIMAGASLAGARSGSALPPRTASGWPGKAAPVAPPPAPDLPRTPSLPAPVMPARGGSRRGLVGYLAGLGTGLLLMTLSGLALWLTPARGVLVSSTEETQTLRAEIDKLNSRVAQQATDLEAAAKAAADMDARMANLVKAEAGLREKVGESQQALTKTREELTGRDKQIKAMKEEAGKVVEAHKKEIQAEKDKAIHLSRMLDDYAPLPPEKIPTESRVAFGERVDNIIMVEAMLAQQMAALNVGKLIHDANALIASWEKVLVSQKDHVKEYLKGEDNSNKRHNLLKDEDKKFNEVTSQTIKELTRVRDKSRSAKLRGEAIKHLATLEGLKKQWRDVYARVEKAP